MAYESEVFAKVKAKTEGAESVKSLKTQIREAVNEATTLAQKFGELSPEAIAAAQKVAKLKDEMQDFQQRVAALNPDKFDAIGKTVGGIAGGISAAQGAMALFGAESEDTQKALLKVQGAMAFAQGVQQVLDMKNSLGAMGTMIKGPIVKAFSTLRGAIIATGIGALVVLIGLLLANFDKVYDWIMKSPFGALARGIGAVVTAITDFLGITSQAERDLEKFTEATNKSNKELDRQIEVLTAIGGKEKEVYELKKRQAENELNILRNTLKAKGKLTDEELAKFNDLKNKQKVLTIEYNKFVKNQDTKAKEEADKKAAEEQAKANENYKKNLENERKALQDLAEERRKQAELNAKDERALADVKFTNDLERLRVAKANELKQENLTATARQAIINRYAILEQNAKSEHDKKIKEIDKKASDELIKQRDEFEKNRKEITDKEFADTVTATDEFYKAQQLRLTQNNATADEFAALELQRLENQLQVAKDYGQSTVELELQIAAKKKEIYDNDAKAKEDAEAAKRTAQLETLRAANSVISALGGLFKEGSDAAKAAALTDIAINTATGYVQGLDIAQKSAKAAGPGAAFAFPIFYATQIAAVLGAVNKARAILKAGGSGTGGGGAAGVPTAPAMTPVTGGALPDEQQFGGMGRVYVLEGDITKTQTRVRRLRNTSVV